MLAGSRAVYASDRLLEVFARYEEYEGLRDRLQVHNSVSETIESIKASLKEYPSSPVTLLASGDPMFFGIGRRAVEAFGKEMVEIIPDVSSIQEAFARICEPWDNAFLVSMHGGPDPHCRRELEYGLEDLPELLASHNKLAILTDGINNPAVIAKAFAESSGGLGATIHVCEKLGYPDEKITAGKPAEIMVGSYCEPNIMIIKKSISSE